jgi:hypothetical protein
MQKKELLSLFVQLASATPPQGDAASWKSKTGALVQASEAVVEGKVGSGDALKRAANCKACHDMHKGN